MIKQQIRFQTKNWRKSNMKIVSIPFQLCKCTGDDDWLMYEGAPEDLAQVKLQLCEQEIRELNSDFNYKHYGHFMENAEEPD